MSRRQNDLFPHLPDGKKYVSDIPELVAEWHPTKNKGKLPEDVSFGVGGQVWWKCSHGHEWQASPNQRTSTGSGCPHCYNLIRSDNTRKATYDFNLKTERPDLCKEWHPTKNLKTPDFYMPRSMDKVWWMCCEGHEWKAVIDSRTSGRGCPYCSGYFATEKRNLAVLYPNLVAEWHPSKNAKSPEQYTPYSNFKVWWQCNKGHEWEAGIASRSQGTGCPKCSNQQSKNELRILTELLAVYDKVEHRRKIVGHEVDICLPDIGVAVEYDGNFWHQSKHEADVRKQINVCSAGFRLIRIRELPLQKISDEDILIDGRQTFKKATVDALIGAIGLQNQSVSNYLSCADFTNDELYVQYLSYFPSPLPEKSLAQLAPNLCKEWHPEKNKPLTPQNFPANSADRAWWVCHYGHEYQARIAHRFKGSGCPMCSGRKATTETCMQATHPELAALWHPDRNGTYNPVNIKAGSGINIWWKCEQGHEWQATPNNMKKPNRRRHCPYCKTK